MVYGFSKKIAKASPLETKLYSASEAMCLAKQMGIENLIMELDALCAVKILNSNIYNIMWFHILSL